MDATKVEPDGVSGWCLKCALPCFVLAGTCRGCAGPALEVPPVLLAAWGREYRRANLAVEACDQSRATVDRVADERDALLAACKAFEEYYAHGSLEQFGEVHAQIHAAVAKAEQSPTG